MKHKIFMFINIINIGQDVKDKVHPITSHEGPEGKWK
jgi:hypothetical protein